MFSALVLYRVISSLFYMDFCIRSLSALSIMIENCKIRIHRKKSKGKKRNFKFRNPIRKVKFLYETLCRNLSIGIACLYILKDSS